MSTLLSAPLASCRWELERRQMVPPSNDALRQIIETDTDLVDTLNEFYGDAAADGGLDKIERELLLDLLSSAFHPPAVATHRWHGNDAPVHGNPPASHERRRLEG